MENLFLSLGAALGLRANQQRFLDCEGFELLMRCLKEQQYAAGECNGWCLGWCVSLYVTVLHCACEPHQGANSGFSVVNGWLLAAVFSLTCTCRRETDDPLRWGGDLLGGS